jgi:hypothetical protein
LKAFCQFYRRKFHIRRQPTNLTGF